MAVDINEKKLVEKAKHDVEAFGTLYELYIDKIYSYVFNRTGNRQDAEDLTAKVFHRALDNIHRYSDKGVPFSAWLFRIAHNLVANWHRDQSKGHRQTIDIDKLALPAGQTSNPQQMAELANQQEILLAAVRKLPSERQDLLVFKFVERMSNTEIGQTMGRTESAVKSLYHRTLISLRKLLTEDELVQKPKEND
ncbi:sigma-70 family RNA polymerase sigma factor [Anaerolineales bacterium HSG6]|nr:sigma-70 family RNA polymerase sigma factor [Anaerolineales bacterium HSG6]MDM8532927.1 sigma-70 family RNA polymerase sigma factor [Anaerolineales bacterium HSG25]